MSDWTEDWSSQEEAARKHAGLDGGRRQEDKRRSGLGETRLATAAVWSQLEPST